MKAPITRRRRRSRGSFARRSRSPIRTARRSSLGLYTGAQFVAIPEFQGIGTQVGQTIAGTLTGQSTVDQALKIAQSATERTMRQAGYPKK